MRLPKFRLIFLLLLPTLVFSQSLITPSTTPPYLDPSLPIETRVNDLLSRLTLDEKISQMQDVAPAIPRLQIPAYNWWNEGLHGVARSGNATVFPQAIGLAATWDADLLHSIADVISTEARAKYNDAMAHNNSGRYYGLTFWSPNINIFRDPRWGRGQETYGEDPYLTARLGVAFVTGLQGNDAHYLKTVSTPKHYAVHSGPESLRHRFDAPVSLHDLFDTYTPAFRATVVEAHADSIMCAYNSVRGEPACANHLLLDLLRNTWGFRGYVVSDCWAINDLYQGHGFTMSLDQAAALSLKAGTDLTCGPQYKVLDRALEDRLISLADIDRAVARLFEARFRLGMFDPPDNNPWSKLTIADVDTPANRKLALQAAQESIVLLKNALKPGKQKNAEGGLTLPLNPSTKSIAVVGPTADSLDTLLGNYNGNPSTYSTILSGIKKRYPNAQINYAVGAPLTETRPIPIPTTALRTVTSSLSSSSVTTPGVGPSAPKVKPATYRTSAEELPSLSQSTSTQNGLSAEFFNNPNLFGSPVFTRTDPFLDFEWNNVSPAPNVSAQNYSARWTGSLAPPVDGDYRLGAACDGGCRLYLNGKILIDNWTVSGHGERTLTTLIHLQANHAYPIKFEYFHNSWESAVRLLWLPPNLQQEAVDAARKSEVVIAVVGITAQLEGEESENSDPGFFGGDRTDITLPATQEQLLEALAATDRPLVVVLTSGSALAVNWADQHASAILEAWYPGEEGGTALASVLSGDFNPSGRLPVTFYKSIAQLPPFTEYSMSNRTYRYLNEPVLYSFGHGLSYSTFAYSDPKVVSQIPLHEGSQSSSIASAGTPQTLANSAPEAQRGSSTTQSKPAARLEGQPVAVETSPPITVSAKLTNASKIPGDEIVELYLSHPNQAGAPIRALVGFQRIHLAANASQTVTFTLTQRDLSIVDPAGLRQIPAGPVELWLGSCQPAANPTPNGVPLKFTIDTQTNLPN